MTFHYFYFDGFLPFDDIQKHFPEVNESELRYSYWSWHKEMDRRLHRFYTAQRNMHHNIVLAPLAKLMRCGDIETLEERYPDDYQRAWIQEGLEEHHTRYGEWTSQDHIKAITRELGIQEGTSIGDFFKNIAGRQFRVDAFNHEFDALWFNYMVDKYPRDINGLRRLPYPEYLSTEYWKRVRALMLILYGARCQGAGEPFYDTYWNGSEFLLHVHHLSYKNRGAERFTDLTLLCKDCHVKAHKTGEIR